MITVEKLVRQISEVLASGNGAGEQASGIAADYARLCHDANQRLEQCAAMISKGSEYQALQLAETEPELLDLISDLSFAESKEWAEFCEKNHLPTPERIDARAVTTLNDLYSKGISPNHPLYKDYRAAVSSRDDGRAVVFIKR